MSVNPLSSPAALDTEHSRVISPKYHIPVFDDSETEDRPQNPRSTFTWKMSGDVRRAPGLTCEHVSTVEPYNVRNAKTFSEVSSHKNPNLVLFRRQTEGYWDLIACVMAAFSPPPFTAAWRLGPLFFSLPYATLVAFPNFLLVCTGVSSMMCLIVRIKPQRN